MNKPKDRITLRQVVDMIQKLDTKVDAGFKQVNDRIDRIEQRLDYNNLRRLPDSK